MTSTSTAKHASRSRRMPSVDELEAGIAARDRSMLGRAFTLVESLNPSHRAMAEELLERLLPRAGGSIRVGISGVPGAGKSTFIEALGTRLVDAGRLVAVLAIDPSSEISGGSILGDKTRMERLSASDHAVVRPSPSGLVPGGAARATRESIVVAEAAGFDVVLVETVGVGQSETEAAWMTDFFLLLAVAGTGDELQGIKRGVLELADAVAVNKADGENALRARDACHQLAGALHMLRPKEEPIATTCSSLTGDGIMELWSAIEKRVQAMRASGALDAKRRGQAERSIVAAAMRQIEDALRDDAKLRAVRAELVKRVQGGEMLPTRAASELVAALLGGTVHGRR